MARELSLDAIGILEGTNKSSLWVDYLRHYERLFCGFRNDSFNIIEIGVHEGASLRAWARFFPRANIIGIDIAESCKQHEQGRIKVEIGDQTDLGLLTRICAQYPPKIFIDDGSHASRDVLFTFQTVFPLVLPGGFYVMEDLFLHYGEYGKLFHNSPVMPSDYVFRIGHGLLADTEPKESETEKKLYQQVDRIEILRFGLVVGKKYEEDTARLEAEWWPLLVEANRPLNWILIAQKLVQEGGPLDRAAEAYRKCIEFEPLNLHHHYHLADILDRVGDLEGAVDAARRSVELSRISGVEEKVRAAAQHRLDQLTEKQFLHQEGRWVDPSS